MNDGDRAMMELAIDCLGKAYVAGAYPNADAFFDDLLFMALLKSPPENGRATGFGATVIEMHRRIRFCPPLGGVKREAVDAG